MKKFLILRELADCQQSYPDGRCAYYFMLHFSETQGSRKQFDSFPFIYLQVFSRSAFNSFPPPELYLLTPHLNHMLISPDNRDSTLYCRPFKILFRPSSFNHTSDRTTEEFVSGIFLCMNNSSKSISYATLEFFLLYPDSSPYHVNTQDDAINISDNV